jgi:WD40 repeat protein
VPANPINLEPRAAATLGMLCSGAVGQAAGFMQLLALKLAGALPGEARAVDVPALINFENWGRVVRLSLKQLSAGPPGLHPDPETMAFLLADDRFMAALTRAWAQSEMARGDQCVLWSLTRGEQPCSDIVDGSLAGALCVALDELHRAGRHFGRLRLKRLDQRCAITATLAIGGQLGPVAQLDNKLRAAHREQLRVVVGANTDAQRDEAESRGRMYDVVSLGCAASVQDAVTLTRTRVAKAVVSAVIAALVALVLVGTVATILISGSDEREGSAKQRQLAATVASKSVDEDQRNPRLAALLALASQKIDPGPTADEALMHVAQADQFVSRVIPAANGQLNTIAQNTTTFFTGGDDGKLRIWSKPAFKLLATVSTDSVITTVSADTRTPEIASAGANGDVRLWDVHDPAHPVSFLLPKSTGAPEWVNLQFNEQGTRLAGFAQDGTVTEWDVPARIYLRTESLSSFGTPLLRPNGRSLQIVAVTHDSYTSELEPSSDMKVLVATNGRQVLAVDLSRKQATEITSGSGMPGDITALAEEQQGDDYIAMGTSAGVVLWDRTGYDQVAFPLGGISEPVNAVAWSNGKELVIATNNGVAIAENRYGAGASQTALGENAPADSQPRGGETSDLTVNGSTIAGAQEDGNIMIFNPRLSHFALPSTAGSDSLAFDDQGNLLLTQTYSDSTHITGLYLIHPSAGKGSPTAGTLENEQQYPQLKTFSAPATWWPSSNTFYVNDAVLTGDLVVASGQDPFNTGAVMVWNAKDGQPIRYLRVPGGNPSIVTEVALVPSRQLMVAYSTSGELVAWSTRTWNLVGNVYVGPTGGFSVNPSEADVLVTGFASNKDVGTASQNTRGDFLIVSLKTLTVTRRVPHGDVAHALYSPDGHWIATVGDDREVSFYAPNTLRRVGVPLSLEGGFPVDVAWRQGSRELAVSTFEGTTFVIDVRRRDFAIPPLVDPNGYQPVQVAWDPIGDLLAVGSRVQGEGDIYNGKTDFWRVNTTNWDSEMCAIAGGGLSRGEWEHYVGDGAPYRQLCPKES